MQKHLLANKSEIRN